MIIDNAALNEYPKLVKPILLIKPGHVVKASNDKAFKNLANDIHNKKFVAKIINLSTGMDFKYLNKHIRLLSQNTTEGSVLEHFNEQDVIVSIEDDLKINIEMSIDNKNENILKNQITAFKLAGSSYKVSEKYDKIHAFIQIVIENYEVYHNDLLITEVALTDISSGNYEVVNNFYKEYHINLKNLSKECYNKLDEKNKFFKFFTLDSIKELEELCEGDEIMEDALDKLKSLSSDPGFISKLEQEQIREYARRVALEQEKQEIKKQEKIEMATNLLKENVDANTILKCTGLTMEELKKIIDDNGIIIKSESQQIKEYARRVALEQEKQEIKIETQKQEKIEMAKKMLKENIDTDIIIRVTGLTKKDIQNL